MDISDITQNCGAVATAFLFGEHTSWQHTDITRAQSEERIQHIGALPILYDRISQTRLFRRDLLEAGAKMENLRALELNANWLHGPALPPPTTDDPFSVKEPSGQATFRDILAEEGQIGFHDFLLQSQNKRTGMSDAILNSYKKTFGDRALVQWKSDLNNNRSEAAAAVTRYREDALKSHAFYEMNRDFVGMDFLKERLWKLKKSYDLEVAFNDPSKGGKSVLSMHMALLGPRGMGKTEMTQQALGPAMKRLGLITNAECVTMSLSSVVGSTLGVTESYLRDTFEKGKNGIVLFDEVDTVAGHVSKGQSRSAISQIINEQAEKYRTTMALVVATYPEMADAFFSSDPGLPSRFGDRIFYMPEYRSADFVKMFENHMNKMTFTFQDDSVRSALWEKVTKMRKEEAHVFGNGRTMRDMAQFANAYLAERLEAAGHSLSKTYGKKALGRAERTITETDMDYIVKNFKLINRPEKESVYSEENPFLKTDKIENPAARMANEVVPFPNPHQPKLTK